MKLKYLSIMGKCGHILVIEDLRGRVGYISGASCGACLKDGSTKTLSSQQRKRWANAALMPRL